MKVLMISLDRALLDDANFGDAWARHQEYASRVDKLAVIVLAKKDWGAGRVSGNLQVWGTRSLSRWFYLLDAWRLAKKICAREKFDLIVAQDPLATGLLADRLARREKIKFLLDVHGDFLANPYWRKESCLNILWLPVAKRLLRRADSVRAVSAAVARQVRAVGVRREKIAVISTPVNLQQFAVFQEPAVKNIRQQYGGRPLILFVGRLVPAKGLPDLIKALAILRKEISFVCLILGKGPEKKELLDLVKKNNLTDQVFFTGAIDHRELPNYYWASEVLVLPSTNESFGKVLLEAAMAQKPLVATATAGACEIIQDQVSGLLVGINQPVALAAALRKVLTQERLAKSLGQAAYRSVLANYDWEKNIQLIIELWQRAVKL